MTHPDRLDTDNKARLQQILARCPELDTAARHVHRFATMLTNREGHLLDDWITTAEAEVGASPYLAGFATGLRRDHAAVKAGLTLPYSSGTVEGTVNKIIMWNLRCQAWLPSRSVFLGGSRRVGGLWLAGAAWAFIRCRLGGAGARRLRWSGS